MMGFSCARNFAAVALVSVALTGCFDDTPDTGTIKPVDWYKAHDAERQVMLEKCGNNPGELKDDSNCINARQAMKLLSSGEEFELDLSTLEDGED
ncbi:EexN family lipoprotein [Halomonas elongata]|uniref:EexN family lipoprotein n=2 Tax=Halomonas elongata TaxID=2746 RepID=A0ABZ0T2E0_HALED|nr:EexN family lipoprotein [Halomonas elongata]WBF16938.1 EexN family lipoprotein [Halomonas elongata]WPU45769.1 EexN family lipoprotein [Halomonas elongata DSM 2581]